MSIAQASVQSQANNNKLIDLVAVRYMRDFDWHVVPARALDKRPIVKWKDTPKLRPSQLVEFWQRNRELNVAVLTGTRSGIIVADVDPRHGGQLETLWEMGWPQETCIVRTGSGGRHVYAQCPADGLRSVTNYAQGIELKADGTLVIAPPSRHPNGNLYQWVDGHYPERVEASGRGLVPAALPEVALADIRARRARVATPHEPVELSDKELRGLARRAPRIVARAVKRACSGVDGGQHLSGLWLACQLRDMRVSDEIGLHAMLTYQREVEALDV